MDTTAKRDLPPAAPPRVWTVAELNRAIRELLEQTFYPFWVRGEIGNLTVHRSGHVYFTLKDATAQLSAVYFRGAAVARQLNLAEGLEVEAWGRLSVYEPRGQYQLLVERIRPRGVGNLQQRFDELKRRLQAEGLFDADRKRPIPALPRCIGVVTSPDGAAIRDFLQILERRFADVHVRIYPAAVQGERAAGEIAAGVRFLNQTHACEVIVVTRGGGSLEDLWPFNEEAVARAVAASDIPVISAVGHEVDFTICDFVADLRVPTPSAAAELVIGRKAELLERVATLRDRARTRLELSLAALRRRFERAAGSYVFREPRNVVRTHQQRVDELALRLPRALAAVAADRRGRLAVADGRLRALDPRAVLARGYAILLEADSGRPVLAADEVAVGARLRGIVSRGELGLTVDRVRPEAAPAEPGRG